MAAPPLLPGIGALSVPEMLNLMTLFTDEENNTFEQVSLSFQRDFCKKDNLKVGLAILTLLKQQDLLPRPTQRLIAVYLLYEMYKEINNLGQNPFAPVFLKFLTTPESESQKPPSPKKIDILVGSFPVITKQERYFLIHLIGGASRDLLKKSPKQIMSLEIPSAPTLELGNFEAAINEAQSHLPEAMDVNMPVIVPSPDFQASREVQYSEQQAILKTCEQLLTGTEAPSLETYRPRSCYYRIKPPLHEAEDEFIWLHPIDSSQYVPIWDTDMMLPEDEVACEPESMPGTDAATVRFASEVSEATGSSSFQSVPTSFGTEGKDEAGDLSSSVSGESWMTTAAAAGGSFGVRKEEDSGGETLQGSLDSGELQAMGGDAISWDAAVMLQRAIGSQLAIKEANWLVEQITKSDESIVEKVGMTPEKLPSLVESNPLIAVEVLLKLLGSKEISSYFETLIHMDLSVQGLEVVNRLTNHVELPQEVLQVYVLNCIQACEGMQENSLGQSRLVRLVCVFLQALIRNKVINAQDLYIELQAFCVNFNNIREAAALYRVVQTLSSGGTMDEEGGP